MAGRNKTSDQPAVAVGSGDQAVVTPAVVKPALPKKAESERHVYIGPTLPRGVLNQNTVFAGKIDTVQRALADVIEKYPQVRKLLVPVSQLAASRKKIKTGDNILGNAYSEIAATLSKKEE